CRSSLDPCLTHTPPPCRNRDKPYGSAEWRRTQGCLATRRYGIVSLAHLAQRRVGGEGLLMVEEGYDQSKRWWTLVVLCLSLVIVVVGNTVLNVALPTLVRELHASNSAL